MDAVRFGRALGIGARQAVKTVASAVDAATAEKPSSKSVTPVLAQSAAVSARTVVLSAATPTPKPAVAGIPAARPALVNKAERVAAQGVTKSATQARGVRHGLSRFREAAWEPFARLSGVLWLEVTGVFFAIFALFAAGSVWRLHSEWRAGVAHPGAHRDLAGAVIMFALFGYFCVSSFVRARRRERRKG